ncbi:hypothetical protein LNP74_28710 [Klebsiella pneumoniae subsp. pneumoniae]|nr:hypothetical protein [Klebsiella pneumoniae subsp. pneumoniae]
MLVGDASDCATLLQMMLNGMALPPRPESLILPALEGAAPKALGAPRRCRTARRSAPCHNVSKARYLPGGEQWGGGMCGDKKLHLESGYRPRLQRAGETGDGVSAGGQGAEVKDVCEHFPWSRRRSTIWCSGLTISMPSSS